MKLGCFRTLLVAMPLGSDTFVTLDLWEQIINQFPSGIITSLIILDTGLLYLQCPNVILQQERQD